MQKGECESLHLHSNPTDADSPNHEMNVECFSNGEPEEHSLFLQNMEKVMVQQNSTTGPKRFSATRNLLKGDALDVFNIAAEGKAVTVATHKQAIQQLTQHIFPVRALQTQKCWMRHHMRKPAHVTTREDVARVNELNAHLVMFPLVADGTVPEPINKDESKTFWAMEFQPLGETDVFSRL